MDIVGVLIEDVREYVETAVGAWGGSLDPENPFFGLGRVGDVYVAQVNKRLFPPPEGWDK